MRTSALERPEAPLASAACSQRTTRPTPRAASAYAMLTPLTPPPTTTTSAVSVTRDSLKKGTARCSSDTLSCAEPSRPFHNRAPVVSSEMMGEQPFETIVGAHHAEIYRYLRRVTSRAAEAEDLSQETFLRAYRAYKTLGPDANVRAWLFAIATNLGRNHFRSEKRRRVVHQAVSGERRETGSGGPEDETRRGVARRVSVVHLPGPG